MSQSEQLPQLPNNPTVRGNYTSTAPLTAENFLSVNQINIDKLIQSFRPIKSITTAEDISSMGVRTTLTLQENTASLYSNYFYLIPRNLSSNSLALYIIII